MRVIVIAAASTLVSAATAWGHGVQVQITFNPGSGKIETREVVHTGSRPSAISDLKRVYVMPFLPFTGGAGDGWYVRPNDERNAFGVPLYPTGPGVTFQYDGAQLPGTGWSYSGSSTLPNLQGTNFGYAFTDGLKQWNGSAFVDPGTEQLQMFRGDGTAVPTFMASTSDVGPFASLALSSIGSMSSNPHSSMGFRMLGDGLTAGLSGDPAGEDGVYLASMMLTSTAAGVGPSDPFYYIMYKNSDVSDAIAAAGSLGFAPSQIQIVPEPASLGLLAAGTLALSLRRRSRR